MSESGCTVVILWRDWKNLEEAREGENDDDG
jgi:hypothetical protein